MAKVRIVKASELTGSLCAADYIPPTERLRQELAAAEESLEKAKARVMRAKRTLAAAEAVEGVYGIPSVDE